MEGSCKITDENFRLAGGRSTSEWANFCVIMKDYELIFDDLPNLIEKHKWNSILLGKKVAYSGGASYAVYKTIPSNKVTFDASPLMLMKAQKNEVQ